MPEAAPSPWIPEACARPSAWARFLTRLRARGRVDLSCVRVGQARPLPFLHNEAGVLDLGDIWLGAGTRLWAHKGGRLVVGDGTVLDEGVEIIAWQEVVIGRGCHVGWDALVMDTDLHGRDGKPVRNRPVAIGDRVRIGCRAIILKGVTIGHGATILPGAVVTRDVPPGAVHGSPTSEVRKT